MIRSIRLALCQIQVGSNVGRNLGRAQSAIQQAAVAGARLVVLPECFNCPYGHESFRANAERIPDPGDDSDIYDKTSDSISMLRDAARRNRVWIIGGSIPETYNSKLYNTCTVFNDQGQLIAKYRKMHLFDVAIPGKIEFRESETLTAGSAMSMFDFESEGVRCRIGLGICYDLRFPEFSASLANRDCSLLVIPAAFNLTTGPAHWELLIRSRALDNQVYVAAVSPARNPSASYKAWGQSTVCGPWGDVIVTTGHEPDMLLADIDLNRIDSVRQQLPTRSQKRPDLYHL